MAALRSALSETLASDPAIDPHVGRPGRPRSRALTPALEANKYGRTLARLHRPSWIFRQRPVKAERLAA